MRLAVAWLVLTPTLARAQPGPDDPVPKPWPAGYELAINCGTAVTFWGYDYNGPPRAYWGPLIEGEFVARFEHWAVGASISYTKFHEEGAGVDYHQGFFEGAALVDYRWRGLHVGFGLGLGAHLEDGQYFDTDGADSRYGTWVNDALDSGAYGFGELHVGYTLPRIHACWCAVDALVSATADHGSHGEDEAVRFGLGVRLFIPNRTPPAH